MPKPKAQPKPKTKRPPGRPKAEIDWLHVGRLLEAGGTAEGIAATIGIDRDTLYKRCETDNKCTFSTFSQEKRAKGEELLRVAQFKQAIGGNTTMLVWLGKQRLGQKENPHQSSNDESRESVLSQRELAMRIVLEAVKQGYSFADAVAALKSLDAPDLPAEVRNEVAGYLLESNEVN